MFNTIFKFAKMGSKFGYILHKLSICYQRLFPKWRYFAKSGHTEFTHKQPKKVFKQLLPELRPDEPRQRVPPDHPVRDDRLDEEHLQDSVQSRTQRCNKVRGVFSHKKVLLLMASKSEFLFTRMIAKKPLSLKHNLGGNIL